MEVASSKSEARGLPRITMRLRVYLVMSEDYEILAVTRDMSDGGLFVLVDSKKCRLWVQVLMFSGRIYLIAWRLPGSPCRWYV